MSGLPSVSPLLALARLLPRRSDYDGLSRTWKADVIAGLELPGGARPIVLFDSYYLCHEVAQACEQRGWKYVGVAKKNRNFSLKQ